MTILRLPICFFTLFLYAVWSLLLGGLALLGLLYNNETICQIIGNLIKATAMPIAIFVGLAFVVTILYETKKTKYAKHYTHWDFVEKTNISNRIALADGDTKVVERLPDMRTPQINHDQTGKPQNDCYYKPKRFHLFLAPFAKVKRIIKRVATKCK